jgi:hypothetical protein
MLFRSLGFPFEIDMIENFRSHLCETTILGREELFLTQQSKFVHRLVMLEKTGDNLVSS